MRAIAASATRESWSTDTDRPERATARWRSVTSAACLTGASETAAGWLGGVAPAEPPIPISIAGSEMKPSESAAGAASPRRHAPGPPASARGTDRRAPSSAAASCRREGAPRVAMYAAPPTSDPTRHHSGASHRSEPASARRCSPR